MHQDFSDFSANSFQREPVEPRSRRKIDISTRQPADPMARAKTEMAEAHAENDAIDARIGALREAVPKEVAGSLSNQMKFLLSHFLLQAAYHITVQDRRGTVTMTTSSSDGLALLIDEFFADLPLRFDAAMRSRGL